MLILGTSRESLGLSTSHPSINKLKPFNAAISGGPAIEPKSILTMMADAGKSPQSALIGLYFEHSSPFGFNHIPDDYAKENFNEFHRLAMAFQSNSFIWSIRTLISNFSGGDPISSSIIELGITPAGYPPNQLGQRKAVITEVTKYFRKNGTSSSCWGYEKVSLDYQHEITTLFKHLYENKVSTQFMIGPSHALQWETISIKGHWAKFEDWKRFLVQTNEEVANSFKAIPFSIWDFSGYNSITSETIPRKNNTTKMHYYVDSSHYTPATGNLVLDRMFDYHTPDRKVPNDFGVRITSANIEAHLASIRTEREQYLRTHPDEVSEIEALAQKVAKEKHCNR